MKLTMDEAMKHRVVGVAVIVSIALVFIPAMIKKNNQRLEEKKIAVELPAKPPQPQMAEVDEPKVFSETKVAHVDLDTQHALSQTKKRVNEHPISDPEPIKQTTQVSYPNGNAKVASDTKQSIKHDRKTHAKLTKLKVIKKSDKKKVEQAMVNDSKRVQKEHTKSPSLPKFSVQVGVFSERTNAQTLQKELSHKGYRSRLVKTSVRGKPAVKVLIGSLATAEAAQQLKLKLAREQDIKGFVTKGVG